MTELEQLLGDIVLMLAKETGGGHISYDRLQHGPNEIVEISQTENGIYLKLKNVTTIEGVQNAEICT